MATQPPSPVHPGERIVAFDLIRGFAICGVLVAYCVWNLGSLPPESFTPLDAALAALLSFFIDGKFYTLLAFLFGLGFQLQVDRQRPSGEAVHLYRRRLWILAGIGLAHALLLRNGDILLPYALVGLLLTFFRRSTDRRLFAAGLAALLLPFVVEALWQASGVPQPDRPDTEGWSYMASNLAWVGYWYATAIVNWPPILCLFLLGLWAGRSGRIRTLIEDRPLAPRLLAGGLAAGLGFFAARSWLPPRLPAAVQGPAASLLFTGHAWGLASAYAAALVLALRTGGGRRTLAPLVAAGRMALTNYLLQPVLIVPICIAFGLFDRFTPSTALLLALAILALQLPFSLIWLRYLDYGPAEWLWRYLTYGRVPITRRVSEASL